jgi:hypothetical protein
MANDIGEKEREFIEGLRENTGRDLDEWMQAIAEQALPHRDDIIAWLRQRGLMFSKASWLERIHNNGGRPIYAGVPKDAVPRRPARRLADVRQPSQIQATSPTPTPMPIAPVPPAVPERTAQVIAFPPKPPPPANVQPPAPPPASPPPPAPPAASPPVIQATPDSSSTPADLDSLLVKAKAYRPLAQHVLAKIKQVSPEAVIGVRESSVTVGGPLPFAVLGITPKELRLHLALGDHPLDDVVKRGQAGGGLGKGEALSHMLVLNDARQVDARFMELLALAANRAGA